MFTALHKKFLVITPFLASAFAQTTTTPITTSQPSASSPPSSLSLPANLAPLIPTCAQSCVESVLFDEWPLGCSTSGDLDCLCSQYSTTGLTLGEAAYACAVTSCPSSTKDLASTYSICLGQDGAVVATHSTLTFTAHITSTADTSSTPTGSSISSTTAATQTNTTSTLPSSSTSLSSSSRTSSRLSSSSESSASPTSTASASTSAVESTTAAPSSASASATAAAAGSSGHGNGSLSTAQIIGISVASVSAVVLAVGVLFLLACLRKRDRKKLEDPPEKQGKPIWALTPPSHDNVVLSPTALEQFPSPPRNRRDPRAGGGVGIALTPPRKRAPTPLENIGLAITEDTPMASPASFESNRTLSQLLPDKPEPVLPRPPAAVPTAVPFIAKKKKPSRPDSSMTVFEEDTAVRKPMHPARAVEVPPIRPYRPPPSYAQGYTVNTRQPPLSLAIPPQGRQVPSQPRLPSPPIPEPLRIAKPPFAQPPPVLVLPPDAHGSASSASTKFTGTNSTASSSYIPAYYTSPPTSIMQTPPESYGHGGAFGGPSPQRQAQTSAPPVASDGQQTRLPPPANHASVPPQQQQKSQRMQVTNPPPALPPAAALRQSPPVVANPASYPGQPVVSNHQPTPAAAYPRQSSRSPPRGGSSSSSSPPRPGPGSSSSSNSSATNPPHPPRPRPPPPRPQRSTSSASMTSFEVDDLYADVTPPEELPPRVPSKHLASEGAGQSASPISAIKYPKIPRASNQAVPRTSPSARTPSPRVRQTGTPSPRIKQTGTPSPRVDGGSPNNNGLLARRGNGGGLLIDPAPSSILPRTPPGQTAAEVDTDQARKSSAALPWEGQQLGEVKTPTWVPRLTPTRRGDGEMVLAVGR